MARKSLPPKNNNPERWNRVDRLRPTMRLMGFPSVANRITFSPVHVPPPPPDAIVSVCTDPLSMSRRLSLSSAKKATTGRRATKRARLHRLFRRMVETVPIPAVSATNAIRRRPWRQRPGCLHRAISPLTGVSRLAVWQCPRASRRNGNGAGKHQRGSEGDRQPSDRGHPGETLSAAVRASIGLPITSGLACAASAISIRASPMSRSRSVRFFWRHRRSSRRIGAAWQAAMPPGRAREPGLTPERRTRCRRQMRVARSAFRRARSRMPRRRCARRATCRTPARGDAGGGAEDNPRVASWRAT